MEGARYQQSVQGGQSCRGQSVVSPLESQEFLVQLEVVTRGITTPAGGEECGDVLGQSKDIEPLEPLLLFWVKDQDLLCLLLLGLVVILGPPLSPLILLLHHHIQFSLTTSCSENAKIFNTRRPNACRRSVWSCSPRSPEPLPRQTPTTLSCLSPVSHINRTLNIYQHLYDNCQQI